MVAKRGVMRPANHGAEKRNQVLRLAPYRDSDEIAALVGIDEDQVLRIIAEAQKDRAAPRQRWQLRCLATGRVWGVPSRRAAYVKAQILGLTDYDWAQAAPAGAA